MRQTFCLFSSLLIIALATSCSGSSKPSGQTEPAAPQSGAVPGHLHFVTEMSGNAEVPKSVETKAWGEASFQFNKDVTEMHYRVTLHDTENDIMAHIHTGTPDENGPIVVWLYPPVQSAKLIPGMFNGVLAEGSVTASDLVGPLQGEPLEHLRNRMEAGYAYVQAHTKKHPEGEIRGQIEPQ